AIEEARAAYDALTNDQKNLVDNLDKLTDAEYQLANLTATGSDRSDAQDVIDLINKIGDNITAASEDDIEAARNAYDKLTATQKALVTNYYKLVKAEEALEKIKSLSMYQDVYKTTGDYLESLGIPEVGSIGGEWMVIGLARSEREVPAEYYDNVIAYIQENIDENERLHPMKSSDNSRLILALTAMGMDVTDVDGHNLLAGLNEMDYILAQGINGPIWALIALDSGNYEAYETGDVTREALIQTILDAQLADGGWAMSGEDADADLTAMALQALAPYYEIIVEEEARDAAEVPVEETIEELAEEEIVILADLVETDVNEAVENGIVCLSLMQNGDGSYGASDGNGGMIATSESISQVIVALTALGIDPQEDERFIKNGCTAIDALIEYYVEGGGFRHIPDGLRDDMATEQGYYALTAYARFLTEKTRLYDMTDAFVEEDETEAEKVVSMEEALDLYIRIDDAA
ncbi:MAG: hypothetical protein J6K55_01710, partial [Clostridia bacterium]|nr:hypothetical protein [Clostridia bacterium]